MKETLRLLAAVLLIGAFAQAARAGIRGPGKYSGVVIFDRWDSCTLYSGIYVMYISESVKDKLREFAGQSIRIDAKEVFQPINPGDGLIRKFAYMGPAPPGQKWFSITGLELKNSYAFRNGESPKLAIEVANRGKDDREVISSELAPTLLMKRPGKAKGFCPADGPSVALITRQAFWVGDESRPEGKGIDQATPYAWSIGRKNALPRKFTLRPGESRKIHIRFDLPEGQYDFLSGYGGGVHGGRGLAGNLLAFDVDKDGRGHVPPAYRTGRKEAQSALASGKLGHKLYGQPRAHDTRLKEILKKDYGIDLHVVAGRRVTPQIEQNAKGYNRLMRKAIQRRFGYDALVIAERKARAGS